MKHIARKLPLAIAVGALSVSLSAFAQTQEDTSTFTKTYTKTDNQTHTSDSEANSYVEINKELTTVKDVTYEGTVTISGQIDVQGTGIAVINDKQSNNLNQIRVFRSRLGAGQRNNATVGNDALRGAQGRVGVNVASGDANQQDNATALSALTASGDLVYSADAEVFAYQDNEFNEVEIFDVINTAQVIGNALQNASGDIGVNVAAGHTQQQKNNLSLSQVFNGSLAEANISAEQYSDHNRIFNSNVNNSANLANNALRGASGNIAVNIGAGIGNQQANHMALASTTGNGAAGGTR